MMNDDSCLLVDKQWDEKKWIVFFVLFLSVLITIFLYLKGLNSGYLFDDYHVLRHNNHIRLDSLNFYDLIPAADSFAGSRQFSMLSFALNYYFFGESIWWLKMVNLLIHCINGIGIFVLTSLIIRKAVCLNSDHPIPPSYLYLPLIVSSLWMVHPLNLTSILYLSQRMASLSSLCIIFGLVYYIWARMFFVSGIRKLVYIPLGVAAFTIIGYRFKENAALLPAYVLILELSILKFCSKQKRDNIIVLLFVAGAVLGMALLTYKFWDRPDWITAAYENRYFSLHERVYTQFRGLVFYLSQIILPSNFQLSLWHDDFEYSRGWLDPISTTTSFLLLSALFGSAVYLLRKLPIYSFGVLWFFVSHSIESTVLSLELIHEHRNYLATFGILVALLALISKLVSGKSSQFVWFSLCLYVGFSFVLFERVQIWSDERSHAEHEARIRPNSPASVFRLGQMYYLDAVNGDSDAEEPALHLLERVAKIDKYNINAEMMLAIFSAKDNIEFNPEWIISASKKLKAHPYMASSKVSIQSYYSCLKQKKCQAPLKYLDLLFDTAFETKNGNLITTAGFYYTYIRKNNEKAEKAFRLGLNQTQLISWTNYFGFLIHANKKEQACKEMYRFDRLFERSTFKDRVLYLPQIYYYKNQLSDC